MNILSEVQAYVADKLNQDQQLSGLCPFIPENRKEIDFEIKQALGQQGIVGIVMVPKATYLGDYERKMLAWQIDELEIDIVENVMVNRGLSGHITGQDAAMEAFNILCPLSGDNVGKFSPISYEQGEDNSLLVNKCLFKCAVYGDRKPDFPPNPPNGKVLYKTSAEGEWLESDASISDGEFKGFASKSTAVEVIIPSKDASGNTVTSIGSSAFEYCSGLMSVTIPDSVTSIRSGAFHACIGLTSVTIPNRVTIIAQLAFSGCTNLTSVAIPDSVENIEDVAFAYCSGLTSVTIGNGVTNISQDAFYECTSVNDVYCYPNPANLTWDEDGKDDFKEDGSTRCHVKAEYLAAYQTKFGSIVNVTFIGDLT